MPTFGEFADFVSTDLKSDGDAPFKIVNSNYAASDYGKRLALILKQFTRETYQLYTVGAEITVEEGDREFSFADTDNCALNLFDVRAVWLSNQQLRRAENAKFLFSRWSPLTPAGTPSVFAQLPASKILLDVECEDDLDDCFAQGFYLHPSIATDDDEVQVPEEEWYLCSRYASVMFRENVASDEVGLTRLARLDKGAYEAIRGLRSRNMRLLYSGGC